MHWIDYIIVLLSILAAIGVGVWFAHKQKDTSQYFAGGGKVPAWAVGISIFATLISSVTFLAYPGAAYADNWILLVQGLMVPVVLVALIGIIVPLFRKVILVVPLTLLLPVHGFGVDGVFMAEPISNVIGGLASFTVMILTLYRTLPKKDEGV